MIITELAKEKIKEIAESEGIGHTSVRVKISGGGCSGHVFSMDFDNVPGELDETLLIDDIQVIIDPLSFQYVEGVKMDFKTTPLGSGFAFSDGEIKSTCGCGNSVEF